MIEVSEIRIDGLIGRVHATRRQPDATAVPAFVLIHGIGMSHRSLERLQDVLAQQADTYSFDLPGFAGTRRPQHQLSVAEYAAFVLTALDQLGVKSCVVLGHSMGAQIAVEAARLRPDAAAQVVLLGPVVDVRRRNFLWQALDLTLDGMLFETAGANQLVVSDYLRCGPRWYLTELPAMMRYSIEDRIAELQVPVLVLRGAQDPVASEKWCRQLAGLASAAQFRNIPRQGHVAQHTAPGVVAFLIQAFVVDADRALGPAV